MALPRMVRADRERLGEDLWGLRDHEQVLTLHIRLMISLTPDSTGKLAGRVKAFIVELMFHSGGVGTPAKRGVPPCISSASRR
jgi:hypothetical protein